MSGLVVFGLWATRRLVHGGSGGKGGYPGGGSAPKHAARTWTDYGCPSVDAPPGKRVLQIHNRCDQPVWPAVIGQGGSGVQMPEGGWVLQPGRCQSVLLASSFPSMRVWGRTGCNEQFKCVTGDCVVNRCVVVAPIRDEEPDHPVPIAPLVPIQEYQRLSIREYHMLTVGSACDAVRVRA
jgi:hypothetical protein